MKKRIACLLINMSAASVALAQTDLSPRKINSERMTHPARPMDSNPKDQSITRENIQEEVYVPNLIGQNVNRIGFANGLKRGFSAKVSEEKGGTGLPKGQILSQSPKAGSQIRKPTEILLVIASGH